MESRRDHALLYDDDCGFCKFCVRTMLRLDEGERLKPVAIQSDEGKRLLTEVPEDKHLDSFHLVTPGGKVLSAGEAAAPLATLLRGGSIPARAFGKYPDQTEGIYRWVARNRSTFGRLGLRSRGPIELEAPRD
jgi:predicted DCC family thiol-disulfide oxidoreductase YuxK